MAITYTYYIEQLKVKDETGPDGTNPDSVVSARWYKVGTDSDGNTGHSGVMETELSSSETPSASFISFSDLVQSDVQGFIEDAIDSALDSDINFLIQSDINQKIASGQPEDKGIPWVTAAAVVDSA